jgi:hypothetical protein
MRYKEIRGQERHYPLTLREMNAAAHGYTFRYTSIAPSLL